MLIARWQVDARFGVKQKAIEAISRWGREIAPQVGLSEGRLMTGSIGALEATIEHNWPVESLAALESAWTKLGTVEAHKRWGEDLEPYVVSGTSRWTIWRVVASD
jgi:hypothetical protein